MKLLVIGCGSIGIRHARNAKRFGQVGLMDAVGARADRLAQEVNGTSFGDGLDDALAWLPDFVIVATDAKSHAEPSIKALENGAAVLVEKPIASDVRDAQTIVDAAIRTAGRLRVACNMRFHPAVQALRAALPTIGRVYVARALYGNYLPDQRADIDYRTTYAVTAEEGGVVLDAIHEFDYLSWLLGPIDSLIADTWQPSTLEMSAESCAAIILQHRSGCRSELHLDYLRRTKRRGCEIIGEAGVLEWTSEGKAPEACCVRSYLPDQGWRDLYVSNEMDANAAYVEMLAQFVKSGDGDCELQTIDEALVALKAALTARHGNQRAEKL